MPTYPDPGSTPMRALDRDGREIYRGTMAEIEDWIGRIRIEPVLTEEAKEQIAEQQRRWNVFYSRTADEAPRPAVSYVEQFIGVVRSAPAAAATILLLGAGVGFLMGWWLV